MKKTVVLASIAQTKGAAQRLDDECKEPLSQLKSGEKEQDEEAATLGNKKTREEKNTGHFVTKKRWLELEVNEEQPDKKNSLVPFSMTSTQGQHYSVRA